MQVLDTSSARGRVLGGGVAFLMLLLMGTSVYALVGLGRERHHARDLTASNQALNDSLRQLRSDLQSMSERLRSLSVTPAPAAPAQTARIAAPPKRLDAVTRGVVRRAPTDPRWQQMQARLTDQEKEIATTRLDLDHARQDLEAKVNSARDDLAGSIARNHDELIALEKRGQSNYYEFQLDKSKQFHKVGPLSLSVRKVNFKHKYYDVAMIVDDRQLEKKHVNLYEPLLLTLADRPQPIELVVNDINNNEVKGYVSEPKYKSSELASAGPTAKPDAKELQRR